MQLSASVGDYEDRLQEITQALDEAEATLINANMFDGTVNTSDVIGIEMLITYYNTTIHMIVRESNDTIDMLNLIRENTYSRWMELNDIETVVELLLENLTSSEEILSNTSNRLVELVQSSFMSLRANLSLLDMQANRLDRRLVSLSRGLMNVSISLQQSNLSVSYLTEEIERREMQVEVAMDLARVLNETITRAFATASRVNGTVQELAVSVCWSLWDKWPAFCLSIL